MTKTKEHIHAEITASLHVQSIQLLINSLAEATQKIAELEAKLAEVTKKE